MKKVAILVYLFSAALSADHGHRSHEGVEICHTNGQVLTVDTHSLGAHLSHGDCLGECPCAGEGEFDAGDGAGTVEMDPYVLVDGGLVVEVSDDAEYAVPETCSCFSTKSTTPSALALLFVIPMILGRRK